MSDHLHDSQYVQSHLGTRRLGHEYHFFKIVDSTNETLKRMVNQGGAAPLPSGTVVVADYQSHGKGRLSRSWHAPEGSSLLFSLLLRPEFSLERANWITMIAGLAVGDGLRAYCQDECALKWPNDVMLKVGGQWKKAAGILSEADVNQDRTNSVVVGIGVNINIAEGMLQFAGDEATSLMSSAGQPTDRFEVLRSILLSIEDRMEQASAGHSPYAEWADKLITVGREVTVRRPDGAIMVRGRAIGALEDGRLVVEDKRGHQHEISAGDATLGNISAQA